MTIHDEIKRLRLAKNWSQATLAAKIAEAEGRKKPLAWQTVQQWEDGKAAPSRQRMPYVAQVLGVTEAQLRGLDEEIAAYVPPDPYAEELSAMLSEIPDRKERRKAFFAASAAITPYIPAEDDASVPGAVAPNAGPNPSKGRQP